MVGDIAHICNRGVEKRKIFMDKQDYSRFRDNLFLLNNVRGKIRSREKDIRDIDTKEFKQEKLVEIFKWCLLPNHYHLLVCEIVEGGILEFTKRVGNAYTKYFNTKDHGRSGYLFQNKARIVPIVGEPQFLYIPYYVDLNPLDMKFPSWKITHPSKGPAIDFLKKYEWSSFKEYFGIEEFPLIINRDLFYERFGTSVNKFEKELSTFIESPAVSTWQVDTLQGFNLFGN